MAKARSLKGHVAHISTGYLRLLNWILVTAAAVSVVLIFVIKSKPTFPYGWGFIGLGVVTIVAGLFGAVSTGQIGCFGCHMMCTLLSSAGLCGSFVVMYFKLNTVLDQIEYDLPRLDAKKLLRAVGALYFIMFAMQLVIIVLAWLIEACGFVDYNEDLESFKLNRRTPSRNELLRMNDEQMSDKASDDGSSQRQRLRERYPEYYASEEENQRDPPRAP